MRLHALSAAGGRRTAAVTSHAPMQATRRARPRSHMPCPPMVREHAPFLGLIAIRNLLRRLLAGEFAWWSHLEPSRHQFGWPDVGRTEVALRLAYLGRHPEQ